jgi:terminase small subunit-like protein
MTIDGEIIAPNKGGRPSEFSQEVFDTICDRMALGQSLRKICDEDGMPHRSTVLRWIKDRGLQEPYSQARDAQYDWIAEEIIRIADDSAGDYFIEDRDGKSVVVPDHARVQRARLQVDSRKWILSKLAPRKYGDKVELLTAAESSSENSDKVVISWGPSVHVIVYPMLGSDGRLLKPDSPEYDAAIEQAVRATKNRFLDHPEEATTGAHGRKIMETTIGTPLDGIEPGEHLPPRQLTYQPEPLPGGLTEDDWAILQEILRLVKRTIPSDDNSPPETILRVIREALLLHFRETEIEPAAMAS